MENQDLANQLDKLLDELDEESLSKMNDEEILELRKKLNPYGRTIEGSDKVLTFSYTDLRHSYLKRMVVTTLIGFLNRMCDEWKVPAGIPVIPVYDYLQNPSKLDDFEKTLKDPSILRNDLDENKKLMKKRVIIKEFLEDMFQYNPDTHVRSSYRPNTNDSDRNIIDTPAGNLAIYQLRKKDSEFNNDWILYERTLVSKKNQNEEVSLKSKSSTDQKNSTELEDQKEKIISKVRKYCTEMIPPDDIFHKYQYYYDSNYEELKEIVNDLYCEKPELEAALNPYQWHDTEDDADKFIDKHKNEVISTIFKGHSGKWNIFAPYKQVRESMRYFNDKTQVLEEIAKQIERDSKLGSDLMKKRIKVKKLKNIKEEGPDDPAFLKWKESNNTLQQMGSETLNEKDYAPEDCPDDAITVPVFRISNGGTNIEKTHFYSQSEAPKMVNGTELEK